METFSLWYDARHEYAREWKRKNGGKVLGYFCTYFPEEILYAAQALPVRIMGSHEQREVTEPPDIGMACPFCHGCVTQGLEGHYDYLDGIGVAQSCLPIRQAYADWQLRFPTEFDYCLPMPDDVESLRGELEQFMKAVQEWTGRRITGDDLLPGIEIVNQSRRLMREVYDLRKTPEPPVTGLESMYMVVAGQMVDKRDHNAELEMVLPRLKDGSLDRETGTRLMIIGSEVDNRAFLDMVESLGATVVVDEHCTGSRYFWNEVEPEGADPLTAIARRYLDRPPCPSRDWPHRSRIDHTLRLARNHDVHGAIIVQQKACGPHERDIPALMTALEESADVPSLLLEFDVTVPIGQLRFRCEAFLETVREKGPVSSGDPRIERQPGEAGG
ncbi:MAG: 2-hydroxyacyl-CoA dehydratase [Planctomycetota bacterium]|jgi:benzoyl-CoA reductase subunit C